eukprot:NODE_5150_length_598_cov_64.794171_g4049_i1.p1 GENE.NODE_5150_length_598_cov_64.794171_g4049_i1~~NODE_5150_length_598_cov_64.794171_g4049_i1.p1  ORF type:complete len:194 (-),score=52.61 NODE_5150_length_598_cov_64.794171_g4049_i1:16-534(-)
MAEKYDMKVLLIGKKGSKSEPKHPNITCTPFEDWDRFRVRLGQSRFLFLPNIHDASPRVASEAMLTGLPVFENAHIIGGWHYITHETGETFVGMNDFDEKFVSFLHRLNAGVFRPREWWTERYGPHKSGEKLYQFINSLERKHIRPSGTNQGRDKPFGPAAPSNSDAEDMHI